MPGFPKCIWHYFFGFLLILTSKCSRTGDQMVSCLFMQPVINMLSFWTAMSSWICRLKHFYSVADILVIFRPQKWHSMEPHSEKMYVSCSRQALLSNHWNDNSDFYEDTACFHLNCCRPRFTVSCTQSTDWEIRDSPHQSLNIGCLSRNNESLIMVYNWPLPCHLNQPMFPILRVHRNVSTLQKCCCFYCDKK